MTKAKTTAAEAATPSVDTTTEGQDTVQATDQTPPPPTEEQEAARLEAEAMLAAKAEAEAAAAETTSLDTTTEGQDQHVASGPGLEVLGYDLDLNTLTFLAVQIDMLNTTGHRLGLVDELIGLYGADIAVRDDEGVTVTMQGISIEPADCMENALTNWANAARRAVMEATA